MQTGRLAITWIRSNDVDRATLAEVVSTFSGVPSDRIRLARTCGSCGSDRHGKPQVITTGEDPRSWVSLSRSGRFTVVAATDAGPVGVDVEAVARRSPDLVTWVRKESVLKATGHGLTIDHELVEVTAPDDQPALVTWPATEPRARSAWMFDLRSPVGFVAAATVLSQARPRVVQPGVAPGA